MTIRTDPRKHEKRAKPLVLRSRSHLCVAVILNRCKDIKNIETMQVFLEKSAQI